MIMKVHIVNVPRKVVCALDLNFFLIKRVYSFKLAMKEIAY